MKINWFGKLRSSCVLAGNNCNCNENTNLLIEKSATSMMLCNCDVSYDYPECDLVNDVTKFGVNSEYFRVNSAPLDRGRMFLTPPLVLTPLTPLIRNVLHCFRAHG